MADYIYDWFNDHMETADERYLRWAEEKRERRKQRNLCIGILGYHKFGW